MNAKQLTHQIGKAYGLAQWDAESRVKFCIEELGYDPKFINPAQCDEIARCIRLDLKAGK